MVDKGINVVGSHRYICGLNDLIPRLVLLRQDLGHDECSDEGTGAESCWVVAPQHAPRPLLFGQPRWLR